MRPLFGTEAREFESLHPYQDLESKLWRDGRRIARGAFQVQLAFHTHSPSCTFSPLPAQKRFRELEALGARAIRLSVRAKSALIASRSSIAAARLLIWCWTSAQSIAGRPAMDAFGGLGRSDAPTRFVPSGVPGGLQMAGGRHAGRGSNARTDGSPVGNKTRRHGRTGRECYRRRPIS